MFKNGQCIHTEMVADLTIDVNTVKLAHMTQTLPSSSEESGSLWPFSQTSISATILGQE